MDNQRSPFLSWAYYCQGPTMEELRHSLLYTTLELETTRLQAQEELRKRDDQLTHVKDLLNKTIKERDEAQNKCQSLFLEKLLQQQQQQTPPLSGSMVEDEPRRGIDSNNGFSSSDCEESIVSSPFMDPIPPPQLQPPPPQPQSSMPEITEQLVLTKPLPEKGKFLQAVMQAGPLLQNLLLAGPLPQWRHPPPPLESFKIPPVSISSPPPLTPPQLFHQDSLSSININSYKDNNCDRVNRKRVMFDDSDSETKYRRVALH